jgi:hypothetical protein
MQALSTVSSSTGIVHRFFFGFYSVRSALRKHPLAVLARTVRGHEARVLQSFSQKAQLEGGLGTRPQALGPRLLPTRLAQPGASHNANGGRYRIVDRPGCTRESGTGARWRDRPRPSKHNKKESGLAAPTVGGEGVGADGHRMHQEILDGLARSARSMRTGYAFPVAWSGQFPPVGERARGQLPKAGGESLAKQTDEKCQSEAAEVTDFSRGLLMDFGWSGVEKARSGALSYWASG